LHIPDGLLNPTNPTDLTVLIITWAVTIPFLIFAWKKTKDNYSHTIASTLAVMSAMVFVVQMLNFPVAGGTSVHIVGGTLLAVVLGPFAGMLSMTIVLLMQAFFFADGGLLAFGANALNMAIIGSLSFYIVKFLNGKTGGKRRMVASVFTATWIAGITTALATALEIGVSQAFAGAGGITLTVPTMLSVYSIAGLVEAVFTTALVTSLTNLQPTLVAGMKFLRGSEGI